MHFKLVKKVARILSLLNTHTHTYHKETLEGVGYIYYLDCGANIMGVCIYSNS